MYVCLHVRASGTLNIIPIPANSQEILAGLKGPRLGAKADRDIKEQEYRRRERENKGELAKHKEEARLQKKAAAI